MTAPTLEGKRMKRKFSQFLRLVWIDSRLEQGTINRSDIAEAFGMSIPQASNDIMAYQTDHPDRIEYDHRAKTYKRPHLAKPAYPQHLRLQVQTTVLAVNAHWMTDPHFKERE
jgi:hypothetical protein